MTVHNLSTKWHLLMRFCVKILIVLIEIMFADKFDQFYTSRVAESFNRTVIEKNRKFNCGTYLAIATSSKSFRSWKNKSYTLAEYMWFGISNQLFQSFKFYLLCGCGEHDKLRKKLNSKTKKNIMVNMSRLCSKYGYQLWSSENEKIVNLELIRDWIFFLFIIMSRMRTSRMMENAKLACI